MKNTFTKSLSAIPLGDAYTEEGEINHEYITGQYSPMSDFIENQYVDNTRSTYLNMSGYVELTPVKNLTFTSRVNGTLNHSRHGQYWERSAMPTVRLMQVHRMLPSPTTMPGITLGRIFSLTTQPSQKTIIWEVR